MVTVRSSDVTTLISKVESAISNLLLDEIAECSGRKLRSNVRQQRKLGMVGLSATPTDLVKDGEGEFIFSG